MAKVTVPVVLTIGDKSSRSTITFELEPVSMISATVTVELTPKDRLSAYLLRDKAADGPTFLRLLADVLEDERAERCHV